MPRSANKVPKRKRNRGKVAGPVSTEKRASAHVLTPSRKRREPRQERARFTAASILEAAAEVIDEVGWARASTNRIAERAGVSIGSLYQYFDSKEAILAKLIEQHRESVHEVVVAAVARLFGDPPEAVDEAFRGLFRALIGLHREDPVLTRVLASDVPRQRSIKAHEGDFERFAAFLKQMLEQRPDMRVRHAAAAAFILVNTVGSLARWVAHDAPASLDTDVLIEEIVAMLSGYITGR